MRDEFTQKTKEVLAKRVGFRCSNPNCRKLTSGPHTKEDKATSIGVAAHISAASVGGPRYNVTQSPEDRKHISNGIWLCQNCSVLIDKNPQKYTIKFLENWKNEAEKEAENQISTNETADIPTQPKPYGDIDGWPDFYFGPTVISKVNENTTILFHGKKTLLSEGFCFGGENDSKCQISVNLKQKGGEQTINISAFFYSPDGKIRGQLLDNKWLLPKGSMLQFKYDGFGTEIYNQSGKTFFQINFSESKNEIQIFGTFEGSDGQTIISAPPTPSIFGDLHLTTVTCTASQVNDVLHFTGFNPLFRHDSIGPEGTRLNYAFNKMVHVALNGNALLIFDSTILNKKSKFEILKALNNCTKVNNIFIRSYLEDDYNILGIDYKEIAEKLYAISSHYKDQYDFACAISKINDSQFWYLLKGMNSNGFLYWQSIEIQKELLSKGKIPQNLLSQLSDLITTNLDSLNSTS